MSASLSCPGQSIFDEAESSVRSYARCFPAVFRTAKDSRLVDVSGQSYIDFFMGAGSLNYGHNPDRLKGALVAYVAADGITHGLDMMTEAKGAFIEAFRDRILRPRGLAYRFLFPGPAGATAVEAAVKLARKATGRRRIAAFTNGFHGMTLGALAATGSRAKRAGAGVSLDDVDRYVYDGYFGEGVDTIGMIDRLLCDPSSGIEPPAAILVETVQGEGGLRAASATWLRALAALARRHGSLLIVDDIQAGCGRTGRFFSFDEAGFVPDIVCLSKSLSGYGLPLAMLLVRPEIDVFEPGEHNGTFRGFNWAFVTGRSALDYWDDEAFAAGLSQRIAEFDAWLARMARSLPGASVRGRGMMRGLAFADAAVARAVAAASFERGVVIETSGGRDDVLKFLPALTITRADLAEGLERVEAALRAVCAGPGIAVEAAA